MTYHTKYNLRITKARVENVRKEIKQYQDRIKELEQYQKEEGDCPCAGREMADLGFHIYMIRKIMTDLGYVDL